MIEPPPQKSVHFRSIKITQNGEKDPIGIITSCRSEITAIKPYFQEEIGLETFLKAESDKENNAK